MHDPETFPGVRRAAQEYAAAHGWEITIVLPCNGMAVIERPARRGRRKAHTHDH
jgi:hypothetical protein